MSAPKFKTSAGDAIAVYEIIRRLSTPFTQTSAFKNKLVDSKGQLLKKRADMTREEKKHITLFDMMVFNIKKLLQRLPGGDSKLRNFATALFLLKESIDHDYITEDDVEYLAEELRGNNTIDFKYLSEEISTSIGNGSMDSSTPVVKPRKKSKFGKCTVFHVDNKSYGNIINEKRPKERFSKYIKDDCSLESVRTYAKKNPAKSIMVSNNMTGAMTFLKVGSKTKW